ncbi:MAG: hypothetical protein CXT67_00420 [Methanobacteriota archaeon]|nr:MAG: hypothetical protein CXT67_00420 [Euryarchaeota archaeon]
MGWNNQQPASNALNLSQTGAPSMQYGSPQPNYLPPQQGWYGQQQQPSFFNSMFAGATGQDPYNQQAILPPSETEILMTMLNTSYPVERFLQSSIFPMLLEVISQITTFSLLNVIKNASYNFDEENGVFTLDTASLPTELQTMSSENIMSQMNSMTNMINQTVSNADTQRQQTMQNAQQSMLQSQLTNALADPGMLNNVAQGSGTFFRNFITGGRT